MWEVSSQQSPFSGHNHDVLLMLEICNGLRPTLVDATPKCWSDLMQRCWHPNPPNRPSAKEVSDILFDWFMIINGVRYDHDGIKQQFAEADAYREQRPRPRRQERQHPGACYSSRFVPHISDKVISAYVQSQHNSLDIEQEDWAAEVSVSKLMVCLLLRALHILTLIKITTYLACQAHLENTVNMFGSFILGEQRFVFLYVCV